MLPIFLRGCGKSLPIGEALFVPFICEVAIGETITFSGDRRTLPSDLEAAMDQLEATLPPAHWV